MTDTPLKRKCPLCGAAHGDVIMNLRYAMFDGCPLDPELAMAACNQCGFVFFDTSTQPPDLHRYYINCLFYNSNEQQVGLDPMEDQTPTMDRFYQTAERVSAHQMDRTVRVVDIGANNGAQLIALKRLGYKDLCGLDMRQTSVDNMAAMGLEAHLGSAEKLPQQIQKADVCLISHTLEHLLDPVQVLTNLRRLLNDNGMLYVEVPNAEAYPIEDLSQWYKFMFHEHINHFDLHHLEALAAVCGFETIETGTKLIAHRGSRLNAENKVHCIFGFFKKTDGVGSGAAPCFKLKTKLLGKTRSLTLDPGGFVEKLVQSESRVFLWGISQYTQLMLGSTDLQKCANLQLIDRDPFKQSQMLNRKSIHPPSRLKNISADSVVLMSDQLAAPSMEQFLFKHGFAGRTHILGHPAAEM